MLRVRGRTLTIPHSVTPAEARGPYFRSTNSSSWGKASRLFGAAEEWVPAFVGKAIGGVGPRYLRARLFHTPSGRRRVLREWRHLIGERFFETRPGLAALAVRFEIGEALQHIAIAQDAQHRRHHQVTCGEAVFQIVALAQSLGEFPKPRQRHFGLCGLAQLRPFLSRVKGIEHG